MRTIVVQITNTKALKILKNLEEVNLIKLLGPTLKKNAKEELMALKPKRKSKSESFFSLAGIWEGRDDVSLESIRSKAWPNR